ncbi:hypothetical protein CY35_15G075500 [Sphagnum magellanicum]|nr:hypothetical protein CY35_15G075500 [Sphagnum magellanicum]
MARTATNGGACTTWVWLPMCERRWGSSTQVWSWVTNGSVPFKFLHTFLTRFENLVGFWRGVENGGHGNLVVFDWGPHNITGFRVLPATPGTFKVCKLPFVWIGLSRDGNPVCLMHLDSAHFVHPVNGKTTLKASESQPSSRPLQIPGNLGFSAGMKNPFEMLGPDLNLEQELPAGVVVVDMHFVGSHHIVVEQLQQTQYPFMGKKKSLVEAAAVASFGSSENLVNFFGHTGGGSPGVNSEASSGSSDAGLSPPGSFPYEMYQFLARKVTSPGGDRAARKQQRRERDRAFSQGRHRCEPEHFVKIVHCCPTAARPLQGLWKAVSGTTGLDIVMLSYDDQGGVICRKMGNNPPGATMGTGSVYWTAKDSCMIPAPLPEIEQQNYECRFHNRPTCGHGIECRCLNCGSQDYIDEEVVGMLRATLNLDYCRLNNFMQGGPGRHDNEARVWQYASGRFGFGLMPSSQVLDFRPLCAGDGLADVGDYFF